MAEIKLCWWCQWFDFYGGSRWYSEYTPGSNATMNCWKGHYSNDGRLYGLSENGLRELIEKAETCPDFSKK